MALDAAGKNGSAASELRPDAHCCIMVRVGKDPPNTRLRCDAIAPDSGLPSISSSRPQQACRRARSCQGHALRARWRARPWQPLRAPASNVAWVGAKKRAPRSNKETGKKRWSHAVRSWQEKPHTRKPREGVRMSVPRVLRWSGAVFSRRQSKPVATSVPRRRLYRGLSAS